MIRSTRIPVIRDAHCGVLAVASLAVTENIGFVVTVWRGAGGKGFRRSRRSIYPGTADRPDSR